ncbi:MULTISPECIES: ATP-binding protein [unclassified Streptomyces]|uniref:ATP-binding protein n=1 Tax=unclassified Streptomyces TaxID=2593676 RepID=UPI000DDBA535|nr:MULTISPECIES: ATP-binding protein [unclassified Streptomyces]QZZ30640.1 AAA family ATPase [Streptomyces sp. ST1015]
MNEGIEGLFARTEDFPNPSAQARRAALVGLDDLIERLVTDAVALLDPSVMEAWSVDMHGEVIPAVRALLDRTPLFVFAGDVGVGKTEVAEVIGQVIATRTNADVTLYPLSLTARGRGAVGEMTTLLTRAFERLSADFAKARRGSGSASSLGILLIDEADALAQSRELTQMHHEDRAGVNALLRGIDGMRIDRLPILTILCTNRLDALDPAVQRRAATIEVFERPSHMQRAALLTRLLAGTMFSPPDIEALASATGETVGRPYAYTYSDLRQRLVPEIVLAAYRQRVAVDAAIAQGVLVRTPPTRPFGAVSR